MKLVIVGLLLGIALSYTPAEDVGWMALLCTTIGIALTWVAYLEERLRREMVLTAAIFAIMAVLNGARWVVEVVQN